MSASVHLLWGDDAFLLREAALDVLGDRRATEVEAGAWTGAELPQMATPSLFGEPRALLVTDARNLPKEASAQLAAYLGAPDPDATMVVCCRVAERGKPPAALVKVIQGRGEIRQVQLARKDLEPWLVRRAGERRIELTSPAARAVVDAIGADAGALAAAVDQLGAAFPGRRLTPDLVRSQFRGLGEQKTWDLCDRAFGKDLPGAIRSWRTIEAGGDDPLMVLGGISSRLRDLIRMASLPDRIPAADAAKATGLRFDWQVRRYRQQVRNFSLARLVELHERIAEADRALKSGATGDVVMPALVTAIAS